MHLHRLHHYSIHVSGHGVQEFVHQNVDLENFVFHVRYPILKPLLGHKTIVVMDSLVYNSGRAVLQSFLVEVQNSISRLHIHYLEVSMLVFLDFVLHCRVVPVLGLVLYFLVHLWVLRENVI